MSVLSSTSNLVVASAPKPFVLLTPQYLPARVGPNYQGILTPEEYGIAYNKLHNADDMEDIVAVDFETHGTDPTLPGNEIVGLGIAGPGFSYYLHRPDDPDEFDYFLFSVMNDFPRIKWIAHNVYFDGQWLYHKLGRHIKWHACTFALYRHLATEGFPEGQQWGLKAAMVDLLLWQDPNTLELDQWLMENGYKNQAGAPLHSEMWRAPRNILGKYCALDVEATYLLYIHILEPALRRFPGLVDYFHQAFMPHILRHIEQKERGILIDRKQLEKTVAEMAALLDKARAAFEMHHLVSPHKAAHEKLCIQQYMEKEPPKYLKKKLGKEPARYKKSGEESANWHKWKMKRDAPLVISKNWQNWEAKRIEILEGKHKEFLFNIQSDHHIRWLLYDCLGYEPVEFTEEGLPSVSSKVLPLYGEIGQLLIEYAWLEKEQGYLTDYLDRLNRENRDTLHFGFSMPGTLTGRLSGKDPNLQQLPKNRRCMSLFIARSGHVLVDADWSALEPHVGAELSQDPNLLALYGPGAPAAQDIYLFWGAQVPGEIGQRIRNTGYDPFNPTKEAIARAKKECKSERSLMKSMILSDTYGSGVAKKQQILRNQGITMSLEQVQEVHDSLQEGKQGVLRYTDQLRREWRENHGYIMSALGRPLGLHQKKLKDLWNTQCQSSGHDLHVVFVNQWLAPRLDVEFGAGNWHPVIWDWHDAVTIEVPEMYAEKACIALREEAQAFNKWLNGTVPLKMVPTVGKDLATIKEVEE